MPDPLAQDAAHEDVAGLLGALRERRETVGMGVREAARLTALSPGTIRNMDAADRASRLRSAGRYAGVLGMHLVPLPVEGPIERLPFTGIPQQPNEFWFVSPRALAYAPGARDSDRDVIGWLRVVGVTIVVTRNEQRLSSVEAAQAWGVSPKTLRRLENLSAWSSLASAATVLRHTGHRIAVEDDTVPFPVPYWYVVAHRKAAQA